MIAIHHLPPQILWLILPPLVRTMVDKVFITRLCWVRWMGLVLCLVAKWLYSITYFLLNLLFYWVFICSFSWGGVHGRERDALNLNFFWWNNCEEKIILPFDEFSFLVGYTFYGAFGMSLKVIIFCIRWDHHFCSLLRIILQYVHTISCLVFMVQ